ncbi:class A beta-lactamase [Parasphingopyxis marina]|uniref:Beta-lactamase n=1 Tax=Parasphingopyxis marina TaxID=2761622 RepID=A0A842HXQ0_9SPHN|nr:class A beta-lactamase [Parasphingopyxis marina]MBC2777655.1 class A beta-lactamase [Parasphingopyxis marina]
MDWKVTGALLLALALGSACSSGAQEGETASEAPASALTEAAIAEIEERIGGRVGVALVGADGRILHSYRGGERFAMCSTFKLALSAAVLEQVEAGTLEMDRAVEFAESDLLDYAPAAREHFDEAMGAGQMTIAEMAEAISTLSDNTAANLLLQMIGGPQEMTAFFRRHGDETTRLDRMEPELNENAAGDPRDTTTPQAMAGLVQRLVLGDALSAEGREQLAAWTVANRTGDDRIRAGIPEGWRVGDKTGSCGTAYNDIGIVWPPEREPFVLTVYVDRPTAEAGEVDAAIAEIGRLAAERRGGG